MLLFLGGFLSVILRGRFRRGILDGLLRRGASAAADILLVVLVDLGRIDSVSYGQSTIPPKSYTFWYPI